jgi:hypothetical protein
MITKSNPQINLDFSYDKKLISEACYTKFLRIYVESILMWKIHLEQTIEIFSAACYAMRSVRSFMSQESLKMVYYAYFHCIPNYEIILWRNSPYSVEVFRTQ